MTMLKLHALLIEDDPHVLYGCEQALYIDEIASVGVDSAEKALRLLTPDYPGVIISDIRLPGMDGMALLREVHERDPDLPVILITGHGDVALAVQAMKDGAHDFIEKPFTPEVLVDITRRALEKRALVLEVRRLRQQLQDRDFIDHRIVGRTPAIERVRRLVRELAPTHASVLIEGETGTGKELIAQALHEASDRRKGHFVAVNCGGLPESLFESEMFGHEAGAFTGAAKRRIGKIEHANGGTLFLDEIESMPTVLQIKLLRVLQEKTLERLGSNAAVPVDCRIVAATKEDLRALADAGKFRADLYYRLNVARIPLPPLRERREDIPLLFEHFLLQASASYGRPTPQITPARMRQLMSHAWPGNVRELRNVAELCVLGIETDAPPFGDHRTPDGLSLPETMDVFERSLIRESLRKHDGNLVLAAQALQIPKTTLRDKIRKLGLAGEVH
ncbi:sigma-54-dependent transcriptional regulator [Uliginosibacterium gangwonense]|uniref:sigma-54-dependent transcriptional regulator n=1 Tax=Uliginosibacterium gangwonense TaxID=392736 RepID=UPI00036F01EE|nr:sigma-54 dependent transcriptional regulator [Uliginosibacterium gangwonense]